MDVDGKPVRKYTSTKQRRQLLAIASVIAIVGHLILRALGAEATIHSMVTIWMPTMIYSGPPSEPDEDLTRFYKRILFSTLWLLLLSGLLFWANPLRIPPTKPTRPATRVQAVTTIQTALCKQNEAPLILRNRHRETN